MAREELALETQLLLQEASQLSARGAGKSGDAEASALVEGEAPAVSELEAARQALLDKLRRKKEQRHAQLQQVNQRRYGFGGAGATTGATTGASTASATSPRLTPVKAKAAAFKPPVASSSAVGAHKKKDLLSRLRKQAIQQGSQNMAKLFGYASYEEQIKELNLIEQQKIRESDKKMRDGDKKAEDEVQEMEEQSGGEEQEDKDDESGGVDNGLEPSDVVQQEEVRSEAPPTVQQTPIFMTVVGTSASDKSEAKSSDAPAAIASESESVRVKRRNVIDVDEDDGNEADSEQDGDADTEEDDKMDAEDTGAAPMRSIVDASGSVAASSASTAVPTPKKDRAAGFRELLRAEAQETRRRKRLVKGGGGANFVESEAEEDEEEDALKIGGLGDFGFGVPQAKTQESREAEEERSALRLREDDLEGIVDDLSDDEQAQQQDLDEIFRKEAEEHDREQVKEVMRNVKEGFGRNRRAFSAGLGEARGRFNLDELVAADGSKFEAARLGLLESDEEWSEGDGNSGRKTRRSRRIRRGKGGDDGEEEGEEEEKEEEDEEAEMERMLRERYKEQPQIYVTSSESEGEEEDATGEPKADADADEANSDEEREKQQMKLFSERARVNRRMARMKDLQRQLSLENGDGEAGDTTREQVVPNLMLEEDEDSQELLKILNRTDGTAASETGGGSATHKEGTRPRPMLGRFNSFGAASSFNRVVGNCTLFNAGSGSGQANKGFVFTSLGSERAEQAAADDGELPPLASRPELAKSKSWGQPARRSSKRGPDGGAAAAGKSKRPKKSGLFSVLSSYQVSSRSSSSSHSAPL